MQRKNQAAMDTSRSLEQLEASHWPDAKTDCSPLVQHCHALRKIPISNLSPGDCRVLIGQEIGAKFLVPLALDFLELDPLVEGDYFPGDLLASLIRLPSSFWATSQENRARLVVVSQRAYAELASPDLHPDANRDLLKEINEFITQ